jgi:hypothetical protein
MEGAMKNRILLLAVAASSLTGCLVGRAIATLDTLNIPNTLTQRGFRYVKRGIEARYEVRGIFPASKDRVEIANHLEVANEAYAKLVEAAGGADANQTFINVAVEATLIRHGGELFMVVALYADKIEFTAGAAADDCRSRRDELIAAIRESVERA